MQDLCCHSNNAKIIADTLVANGNPISIGVPWYPVTPGTWVPDGGSAARSLRLLEQSWRMYSTLWLSPK
eukprot:3456073-Rhodomonas_salina.1